ncbi:peptidoglycan editing factor PgeF [Terrihabitans rhizophilus]|uniref:Purine nucleoside phosphorylase n=1 Tax=Terrihabitans rhizophilus TaxID=3092662 RepID=A0ABU4RNK0_9HYPH|nr:peptidoglycan editing factor PgeF [Terrihabitans sp. PJ23]MDX6806384.1 peptidoglycan editing factor PgeF [Terrihabitans sp. PJ23]
MTNPSPVTAPALAALSGISHAFFTREGGVSQGIYASLNGGRGSADEPMAVAENRRRMACWLGVAEGQLATPHQIHSNQVMVALEPWPLGEAPHADAVVTNIPGLAVGVATADCGPILFADEGAGVVAAAHAGWKGAIGGVLEATVDAMEKLGARRGSMVAALGPCIRQRSYEVGPEFVARFRAADLLNERFFVASTNGGHAMFDLAGYIVQQLKQSDVAIVEDTGHDTYADEERFFSYRRSTHRGEPDYGRLVAAIAIPVADVTPLQHSA